MDRAASAKIAGCAVNPPRLRSAAFRVQHAHDSKTYYLPLPIIRYSQAGNGSETAKNEHHRLSAY